MSMQALGTCEMPYLLFLLLLPAFCAWHPKDQQLKSTSTGSMDDMCVCVCVCAQYVLHTLYLIVCVRQCAMMFVGDETGGGGGGGDSTMQMRIRSSTTCLKLESPGIYL